MALEGVTRNGTVQGLWTWGLLALGAMGLPGAHWRSHEPAPFPAAMALVWVGGVLGLAGALALLVGWVGPKGGRSRGVVLVGALPEVVICGALLLIWPAAWGPPGKLGWWVAWMGVLLPGEWRWVAQALPPEPTAYGPKVDRAARRRALRPLLRAWAVTRWPVWLMGSLVVERVLGEWGLASDFAGRLAARDRVGLLVWMASLTVTWVLSRRGLA